jgi:hypothetical protein
MLCTLSEMNHELHRVSANEVVQELQYLSLAIDQVASYVRSVTRDFRVFLDDYRSRRPELHAWIVHGNRQYPFSLGTVWLEFAEREMPVAHQLLQLLHKDALANQMRPFGKDHPLRLSSMNNLGLASLDQG